MPPGGDPAGNVSDLVRSAAQAFAGRTAIAWSGGERTWAQLDRAVDAGAAALRGSLLEPGDRVVVSMPTGPDIIAALFAVVRAGLVAVPVGPDRELAPIVDRVGARGALTDRDAAVDVVLPESAVAQWWNSPDPEPATALGGGEELAVLARAASSDRPVMVSHRAILAAVAAIGAAPSLHLRAEDRAILVLPPYHLAGWVTAFLPLCAVGACAVLPDPPTAATPWIDAVLATISARRVTVVPGAPSLYRRLRTATGVERALASVRLMTSGAAPLDPGDFSAIRTLTGQSVWEGYGISEAASVVSTGLMTPVARPGSVGRPLPGIEVSIVAEDGSDLYADVPEESDAAASAGRSDDPAADAGAGGEVGRIRIGGPTLFSGYWPDGADGPGEDGTFLTGDLGYFDDAGELHLVDRATETIRIAGFTVYPREIEDVLTHHPYVRDAAVIGAPGRVGDAVVAVLVPQRGKHPTTSDLDDFVAERLPVFKRPREYQLVDRLPRNDIGRIDRDAVRTLYHGARPDPSWPASGGLDEATDPPAEDGAPAPDRTTSDQAPDGTVTDGTGPGSTARDSAAPDKTAKDSTASDSTAPDGTAPKKTAQGKTAQGKTAPDKTPAAPVVPEAAAPLESLGSRLPGTGQRGRRGENDTDDDLF